MVNDFLRDITNEALKLAPSNARAIKALELRYRREWGGRRVYIAKNRATAGSDRARLDATTSAGIASRGPHRGSYRAL